MFGHPQIFAGLGFCVRVQCTEPVVQVLGGLNQFHMGSQVAELEAPAHFDLRFQFWIVCPFYEMPFLISWFWGNWAVEIKELEHTIVLPKYSENHSARLELYNQKESWNEYTNLNACNGD